MSGTMFRKWVSAALAAALLATLAAFPGAAYANDYQNPSLPVEQRVSDLLGRMTLQEKIGQMLQVERLAATPAQVGQHFIGSVLSGGGSNPSPNTKEAWAAMVDGYQSAALGTRLGIPILYGVDAVHGHNNVYGATIFPHNVGLGATGDESLVRRIGAATAKEIRTTGIQWDFAPCLCAPQDIRWGRTYEGYSEDPALVAKLGTAFVEGLQGMPGDAGFLKGTKAIGTVKHWLGDGNTTAGDDQGNITLSESALDPYIQPYREAIAAGARSVMISLTTWNGTKMHANAHLITDMLKQDLNFDGMIVSDWNGAYSMVNQGVYPNYSEALKATVNAGIDMFMEPDNWSQFIPTLTALVNGGQVSVSRINDAVSRILRVKFEAGLFEAPYTDASLLADGSFGGAEHRALAREAVRKSAVLLRNEGKLLPLNKNAKLFVAGSKASDIGTQSGGWTISWQGSSGAITPGTTILQGIQAAVTNAANVTYSAGGTGASGHDAAIVVVGEAPSAEMMGDVGAGQPRPDLNLSAADQTVLANVQASGVPTVVIMLSGRPMTIGSLLPDWEAFVAAWLPGTEGAGVSDVLFGDYDFTGKLPFTWPGSMAQIPANFNDSGYAPLFPIGYGLSASATGVRELPGLVEAENHNAASGVQTEATTDASGGLNVGFVDTGDWMEYRVFAPAAGAYKLRIRVASGNGGGAPGGIGISSGGTSLATMSVPATGGWQSWTTVQGTVNLAAGAQTLRMTALAGGWNANWLELIPVAAGSAGNLLANPGFETGSASGWNDWNGGVQAQSVDTDLPYDGARKLTHWAASDYRQLTRQTVNVPNGLYRLSAKARTGGGQNALHLYAKTSGLERRENVSSAASQYWQTYTIDRIRVTDGQLEIGVWSDAKAGNWAAFDAFELVPANWLANPGFEDGSAAGWTEWHGGPLAQKADLDGPASGSYKLTHWAGAAYQQLTGQTELVPNGVYAVRVWARSGTGHQALHLYAKDYGGAELTAPIPSGSANWTLYEISGIAVTAGEIEIGVWSSANAGAWAAFDRFELIRTS
ncbi:glycoside hydrolase family 3 N-terminal domain-containing protein [Paenibacillus sp. LHD-117]|uniref:glycoside hydrolase family 3 N-terminal domain-containing protein n=1 Tax=Paenibacillus sp. LHD-117 TaxID=3071412 RepID=UPI0027E115AF|nr:glycoside hydrolase family 3 N-terminal domain-containing protein [Paenibacillus sp. LHD-117]MDQ6422705.1 glycoside hydrolase family 3 N-terminal domain-containing protein [Paenibacillus sp. LHD-117]